MLSSYWVRWGGLNCSLLWSRRRLGSRLVPGLTPMLHGSGPFPTSGDTASSTKVMRFSLLRSGGVTERPGEAEGVATGVGLRLLRRMEWGVKSENTLPDAANARAR